MSPANRPRTGTESLSRDFVPIRGLRLVVVAGPDAGVSVDIAAGTALIGKDRRAVLRLTDSSVSKTHAKIAVRDDGFLLTDLDSTNGTLYLQTAVREVLLTYGAVIDVGRNRIALQIPDENSTEDISEVDHYGELLGASLVMRRLYALLRRLEGTDASVLLVGEIGSGRRDVALELHRHGKRCDQPITVLRCVPAGEGQAHAQLVGRGGPQTRTGVMLGAPAGTVLLEEVHELSAAGQRILFRELEALRRDSPPHVRVLASSTTDLEDLVGEGRFRGDLLYRLKVMVVPVPSLRQRREDIPGLVRALVAKSHPDLRVSSTTLELFSSAYDWPGNFRELEAALERMVSLGEPGALAAPPAGRSNGSDTEVPRFPNPQGGDLLGGIDYQAGFSVAKRDLLEAFERDYLVHHMQAANNNIREAARRCDVDRAYFKRLLDRYDLRN